LPERRRFISAQGSYEEAVQSGFVTSKYTPDMLKCSLQRKMAKDRKLWRKKTCKPDPS
jgi:hypothetical protein